MFDYAKKIREYRERKFLTQEELAKILGVTLPKRNLSLSSMRLA